jgi:ribonuclease P protein component
MISDGKFHKREHILKTRDFGTVYKKGLSVKNGPLVLCCMPNGLAHSRVGFSISSRNIKLASRRNRIKRLLREAYRLNKDRISGPADLIFIAKRPLPEDTAYEDVKAIFLKLIKSAGIRL